MTATTKDRILYVLALMVFGFLSFVIGVGFGSDIVYNYTITINSSKTIQECNLSCLDARNEGYLDGVAECDMNDLYYEAKDGRYQSLTDNINGFNAEGVAICVQTTGRSEGEILAAFMEELFHQHLFSEANRESICLEHEEVREDY